jgi:hypothetical protein
MRSGLAGVVVVDRTVIVVMMACGLQVLSLVRDVEHLSGRQPTTLHSKAMQGQQHQQEYAQKATHETPV